MEREPLINLRWLQWWFRAYRGCGWSVRRALRAAWTMRRCDPRALPGMMASVLSEGAE